ncbi:FecR domain-containing protein [Cupriavidus agavae]|uniref:FecR family protein n=1 Tax=Cupriavidus agavae TaxID=1001822 RepID=A0A4Q7RTF0_9BURK|nr:FecR domain-containing protein [Cupriavidus agavae]RZT36874.1 FecR family protein [Cupriavidus agavae]
MAAPSDKALEQAALWLTTFESGEATPADEVACARWRGADPAHELAWQMIAETAGHLRDGLAGVPPGVVRHTLRGEAAVRSRRRALKALASVGAIALSGSGGWMMVRTGTYDRLAADHATRAGERRTVTLPDGTVVTLNTASAIDIAFDAQHRQVRLRAGEIDVRSGADALGRPLVIATRFGTVSPIGTRFVVRDIAAYDAIAVGVAEGAVRIEPAAGGPAARVEAGQQASFSRSSVSAPAPLDPGLRAWLDGMLVVRRMPLPRFVAELGRYRRGILRCDPALDGLAVSGAFPLDDTDAALTLLAKALPVRVRAVTPYWITILPR